MVKLSFESFNENSKALPSNCKICGVPARYSSFKCDFDGQCEININNRRVCTSCRLEKCFRSGMSMKLFRSPYSKRINKKSLSTSTDLIKIVNQTQIQMLPTLNLLQSDISTLTNDQWTLLSNLVHSYDERKTSSICRRMI
ncbi:unnamed protein product [Rotaria sordida]|uniref:Nuclear receptor domain-containing protein n=1 Tax=Rotaria sordida TaxID=392033 RepID=A0A815X0W4_9BILA|nr:unnamed protein product [Rotaria sordida]CAF1329185.1 unnamed protein product [Rotaria sordida]CAF1553169.1 unnamed protein product [Rotaria sordida]